MAYKNQLEIDFETTSSHFYKSQAVLKKTANTILYVAFFGSFPFYMLISHFYGKEVASLSILTAWVSYLLGFQYCKTLWKTEKDSDEYNLALDEYKNEHPKKFDENDNYILSKD